MITASVVLFKSDKNELGEIIECMDNSSIDTIILIDNSPTDVLREYTQNLSSKIEYIHGQGNVGYGSAHNIAIRKSIELGATYHVVINPDVIFDRGTIEKLAKFMDSDGSIGQVMPKVFFPSGEIQRLCKLLPSPMDLIGRKFFPRRLINKRNLKYEMASFSYDEVMEIPFLSGCFMFLRVDTLEKIDGFDENIFMYCEDIDLCRRVKKAGYRTTYFPYVSVIHCHKKESYVNKTLLKVHIKSAIYYFNKWGWFVDRDRRKINTATIEELNKRGQSK